MSTIDDLLNKLDEETSHLQTENWRPPEGQDDMAEGDMIAGTILEISENTTSYGTYKIITLNPQVALVNQAQMVLPTTRSSLRTMSVSEATSLSATRAVCRRRPPATTRTGIGGSLTRRRRSSTSSTSLLRHP